MFLNAKPGKMQTENKVTARGRGIALSHLPPGKCLCNRPHCFVLCNVCGYWTKGRVRYFCPVHPQVCLLHLEFYNCTLSVELS